MILKKVDCLLIILSMPLSRQRKQFQATSRENARSFNNQEIKSIVNAYKCILCHRTYEDKIYQDFNQSKKLFGEVKLHAQNNHFFRHRTQ